MFGYLSLYFPFVKIRSLETLPSGERPKKKTKKDKKRPARIYPGGTIKGRLD